MSDTVRVALITATATIVAAGIGAWGAVASGAVEVNVSGSDGDGSGDLEATVTSLEAEVRRLEEENETLTSDLEEARDDDGEVSDQPSGTETTSSDPDEPAPEIRRQTGDTPLPVGFNHAFDLDSTEPNWGVDGDGTDVYISVSGFGERRLTTSGTSGTFAVVSEPPTYEQCIAQTVLDSSLTTEVVVDGQHLCARSSEGRWAYVRIARLDTEARVAYFDVTVWKADTDP